VERPPEKPEEANHAVPDPEQNRGREVGRFFGGDMTSRGKDQSCMDCLSEMARCKRILIGLPAIARPAARGSADAALIRDSKDPEGPRLRLGPSGLAMFLSNVKAGRYEL
jgi:hypothetical protein